MQLLAHFGGIIVASLTRASRDQQGVELLETVTKAGAAVFAPNHVAQPERRRLARSALRPRARRAARREREGVEHMRLANALCRFVELAPS